MLRRAPWCVARAASRAWRSFSAAPEVLVLAETDGCGALRPATHAALAAAAQLSGGASTLLVAGQGAAARSAADAAAAAAGVRDVLLADAPELQHGLAEPLAALLAALCTSRKVTHLVGPATSFGREVVPRAAGLLGIAPVTDIVAFTADGALVRPAFTGNALMTVRQVKQAPCVVTVRASSFPALPPPPAGAKPAEVHAVPGEALEAAMRAAATSRSMLLQDAAAASAAGPAAQPLSSARSVVAGGRGARDAAGFAMLSELVAVLPAGALGATRAAVDAGLAPYETQVGQTGTVVAPRLYIGAGVSGAIQHIAGMKDAGTIVAINKDPDAPLMLVADVALVADLHEAVPQLIVKLKEMHAAGELQK